MSHAARPRPAAVFAGGLVAALALAPGAAAARPTLSGPASTHDAASGRFKVWYTLDGDDALVGYTDDVDPANGVPDAVDLVVEGLDACWDRYVDELGWPAPPADDGAGGDDRMDVYLVRLPNNGLATTEWTGDHWATYLQIDPTLAEMGWELLPSVAAHELHHAIQFTFTGGLQTWMQEASSTYAQYVLYHETAQLQAALVLLWGVRIEDPAVGLAVTGDRLEYAAMSWVKYLVDRADGDPAVFRAWWEAIADEPDGVGSLEAVAAWLDDGDAGALMATYGEWIYFACARDDGAHWVDDGLACAWDIEAPLDARVEALPAAWSPDPAPDPLAAAFVEIVRPADAAALEVSCQGAPEGWALRALPLRDGAGGAATAAVPDASGTAALSMPWPGDADAALLVLANLDRPAGAAWTCVLDDDAAAPGDDDDAADDDDDPGEDLPAGEGCACSAAPRPPAPVAIVGALGIGLARRLSARRGR